MFALAVVSTVSAVLAGVAVVVSAALYPNAFARVVDAVRDKWLGG